MDETKNVSNVVEWLKDQGFSENVWKTFEGICKFLSE